MPYKFFHIRMTEQLFKDFFSMFPGPGERARFLKECIRAALKRKKLKGEWFKQIEGDIEKILDE